MDPADVVLRFLESVGKRSEADFYLQLFRSEPKEQFACLSVDANVARTAYEAVVLHLRFLSNLGLFPVVALGLFEPTDAPEHAGRIKRRLDKAGVPCALISPSSAEALAEACLLATRGGTLPIVVFTAAEGATPEERFARLGALLTTLRTRKIIFLHRPGGLRLKGALVPVVNLSEQKGDLEKLEASKELSCKERTLLGWSKRLVFELVPHKLTVSITSPLNLLRELFTTKGAGTMLRRGARIEKKATYQELDLARLQKLITSAFGRSALDHFFDREPLQIYLEQGYLGAAVLSATHLQAAYLTKFVVDREAQGEGIARDLWDAFAADYPRVFWRARQGNPINDWYTKLADGLMRFPDWIVFWKGLAPQEVPEAVAWALAQPVDLPPVQPEPVAAMPEA
jgi:ribosomal protein S18 acetylase RimI-like enzyme